MTAPALLSALSAAGLTVRLADGKLLLSPKDRITDDLRAAVAAGRTELIELVKIRADEAEMDMALMDLAPGLSNGLLGPLEWLPRRRGQ